MTAEEKMTEPLAHPRLGGLDSLLIRERALEISVAKDHVPDFLLQANACVRQGQIAQARDLLTDPQRRPELEAIFAADPPLHETMYIVGRLLLDTQQPEQAERWFRAILALAPHAVLYHELGEICARSPARHSEAARLFEQALSLEPTNADYAASAARMLIHTGQIERGIGLLDQAILLSPQDPLFSSMRLWYEHYLPEADRRRFAECYRRWCRLHGRAEPSQPFDVIQEPDRPLRVGIVSSSFCTGSIAHTLRPFLRAYDRTALEVVGYHHGTRRDGVTEELERHLQASVSLRGKTEEAMAERIRDDRIDILVEIGGHCHDNPIGLFRYQPAPIQVDFGGIDTTGIETIEWRLTDAVLDPPQWLCHYPEKSVYLPGGSASFVPPATSPPIGPLPMTSRGFATFASFNNNMKINAQTIALWCDVLRALPCARFVLKCPAGDDPQARDTYLSAFVEQGITAERIDIVGLLPMDQYQSLLGSVDLALDTYPFHGCITTLDALWMGVPTVSLLGDLYVARVGLTILQRLGLEVFVASSAGEYVQKACRFVEQPQALEQIRHSLRQLLLESPICHPHRLAQELEQAFRGMWHHWCGRNRYHAGAWLECNAEETLA